MQKIYNRLIYGAAISLLLSSTAIAVVASESPAILKGNWTGLSNFTDSQSASKKVHISAHAGYVTIRIESAQTCLLEGLSGAAILAVDASGEEQWDLKVTKFSDTESCNRIAQGALSIRRKEKNGPLTFYARYTNATGEQIERTGLLGRYP